MRKFNFYYPLFTTSSWFDRWPPTGDDDFAYDGKYRYHTFVVSGWGKWHWQRQ